MIFFILSYRLMALKSLYFFCKLINDFCKELWKKNSCHIRWLVDVSIVQATQQPIVLYQRLSESLATRRISCKICNHRPQQEHFMYFIGCRYQERNMQMNNRLSGFTHPPGFFDHSIILFTTGGPRIKRFLLLQRGEFLAKYATTGHNRSIL